MHIGRSEGLAYATQGLNTRIAVPRQDLILTRLSLASHRGLQAGLALAVVREASKAFFRIGCFQPILDAIHDPSTGPAYATQP